MDFRRMRAQAARDRERTGAMPLITRWGECLDEEAVRAEHPRPRCARQRFAVLNGWWNYAFTSVGEPRRAVPPEHFDGRILVPFSPESLLSGVGRTLMPDELLWYQRTFALPHLGDGERLILHFEAVDFAAAVCVNGRLAETHEGGYTPFSVDLTDYLEIGEAAVDIAVCVWDPSDTGVQLKGRQRLEPGGPWHCAQAGIWQPVWWEVVPARHVESVRVAADALAGSVHVEATVVGEGVLRAYISDEEGVQVAASQAAGTASADLGIYGGPEVREEGASNPSQDGGPGPELPRCAIVMDIPVADVRRWSPDDPCLYHLTFRFGSDVVYSYTAFRTVEVKRDARGAFRFHLNGEPLMLRGVIDEGYWSDGLMTAPSDEAFVFDIEAMKAAGFNLLRKSVKIEAERWYYHCDRLGMLVCQDAVSGGSPLDAWGTERKPSLRRAVRGDFDDTTEAHQKKLSAGEEAYRSEWMRTCRSMVEDLGGHPSVVMWSLFNEGWGQFDACAMTAMVKAVDPTRPVDAASGWFDQHCGDFHSIHDFGKKLKLAPDNPAALQSDARKRGGRAQLLSAFGGVPFAVPGHCAYEVDRRRDSGGKSAWLEAVERRIGQANGLETAGLAGFIYARLSDVEQELDGLLTYDRRVSKISSFPDTRSASDGGPRP